TVLTVTPSDALSLCSALAIACAGSPILPPSPRKARTLLRPDNRHLDMVEHPRHGRVRLADRDFRPDNLRKPLAQSLAYFQGQSPDQTAALAGAGRLDRLEGGPVADCRRHRIPIERFVRPNRTVGVDIAALTESLRLLAHSGAREESAVFQAD